MVKFIEPHFEIISYPEKALKSIENAARTCYQSWDFVKEGSAEKLVKHLIKRKHFAMVEFGGDLVVRFYGDRGLTHELVRHRLASFAQESTRYCNYGKKDEIVCVVYPDSPLRGIQYQNFHDYVVNNLMQDYSSILEIRQHAHQYLGNKFKLIFSKRVDVIAYVFGLIFAEISYLERLSVGISPQYARANLPIDIRAEIVIKANLREWRHIFTLRTNPAAHPLIRTLMTDLLEMVKRMVPVVFDDL